MTTNLEPVAPGLARLRILFVNTYFVGDPGSGQPWVLVDAGLPGSAVKIVQAAEDYYGRGRRPEALLLTHGHFDHVGALPELAEYWDVPIYAHPMELPYLTGQSQYPPPDPTVGGGAMAWLSWTYPRGGIDLRPWIKPLPEDHAVPGLPDWRWIPTPGHSPGHVSFFRDVDSVLIAGDAFVTTKQESAAAVLLQRQEVHGPPAYFTPDWEAAQHSVEVLADLRPSLAATGHGIPMRGTPLHQQLQHLAHEFRRLAVPNHGRYVHHPARTDVRGVVAVPEPVSSGVPGATMAVALLAGVGLAYWWSRAGRRN